MYVRLQLIIATLAIAAVVGALYWFNPYDKSSVNLALGVLLILLGGYPIWRWSRNPAADPIPVLQLIGFFYALCFGVGGLVTPDRAWNVMYVSEDDYTRGLIAALLSWIATWIGFTAARNKFGRTPPKVIARLGGRYDIAALCVFYPVSVVLDRAVLALGLEALSQVVTVLHMFLFLWVVHAALTDRYGPTLRKVALLVVLPIDILLHSGLANGQLVQLLVFGQLLGITIGVTKGRLPLVPILIASCTFFLLQPVKNTYRLETWGSSTASDPIEGAVRFFNLGVDYYTRGAGGDVKDDLNFAYLRINHLHLTSAILADGSDEHLKYGATYLPLLTKWIPRMIWPDKPREDLGNRWAHEYGYLDSSDDVTSFNLPWLPEMYMNFGWTGVVIISFLIGALAAVLWSRLAKASPSPVFAAGLSLLSVFFFPESNLSLELGGLITGGLAIGLACWLIGLSKRDRAARSEEPGSPGPRSLQHRAINMKAGAAQWPLR